MKKRQLICLASEQGLSSQVVTTILNTLEVHPDLIDLPRVASGLLQLPGLDACAVRMIINSRAALAPPMRLVALLPRE